MCRSCSARRVTLTTGLPRPLVILRNGSDYVYKLIIIQKTWKRLQISEQSRTRWESEANRASEEVNILKSQVQHLRNEFTTHREDLIKKLAETKFDAEAVQELHTQMYVSFQK
ncbi:hypothetical protein TNCT_43951 [Trichonephila clavata]|uniref:Uncharacterized protein n=1 Tax=Trichonephila clavata TaxID=2740835 RepID=A0A8X6FJH2_TRICU|nr:hypothetical protein TNCT_43951 [Trichonephila clavata]